MKRMKDWSYLMMLVGMGVIYLTCVDKGQVYAKSWQTAKSWYEDLRQDALLADAAVDGAGNGDSGGQGAAPQPDTGKEGIGSPDGSGAEDEAVESGARPGEGDAEGGIQAPSSGENAQQGGSPADPYDPKGGKEELSGEESPEESTGNPPEGSGGLPEGEGGTGGEGPPEGAEPKEVDYMTVEDDYFADAVFIGDSRTMGLFEYAGLEETAAFYASTGLTVYKMFDSEIVPGEHGKMTVEEALQQNSFAKIYLMIGINEMGTGTVESFLEAYQEAVSHLRELQPDAVIYLQAIIKVTAERSDQGDYINNEGIMARNEGIAQLADNEHIFYLDVNPLICDETGGMIPEYTFDGVHLKAIYIDIWKEFLKTHAVAFP